MSPLEQVVALAEQARAIWSGEDASSLRPDQLIAVNDLLGQMRRGIEGVHARVASEIARQSRPELGPEGLAKQQGFRNPAALIAATTGTTAGEANRLVRVGEATTPRTMFSGEQAPARHPHVASALAAGTIGADAASQIITLLDRLAFRASREALDIAEKTLAEQAAGLTLDQLTRVLTQAEGCLDPDGVSGREEQMRHDRFFSIREDRAGMFVFSGKLNAEGGAPLKIAIEGLVSAELRAAKDAKRDRAAGAASDVGGDAGTGDGARGDGARVDMDADSGADADAPQRSILQMQADALVRLAEHALACSQKDLPLGGVTVIVRMGLEDLVDGTGIATIDGVAAPVSIATARRMAADARVIPCVLGGDSEILDWGRAKRLFTPAQKLVLIERDGGCAKCGAPPGHAKVHHIRWWARDTGRTDLANGVLLCESCHHHIHDNGWDIRIDGHGTDAKVWFIPPAHVDPARIPRLGGRARYAFAA